MPNSRTRTILSTACGTFGLLLIFVAVLIGYVRRSVFEERAFAGHVAASLRDPHVAEYAAEQIADAVIEVRPNLVGVRPLLVGVAQGLVSSPPFRAAVRRGARTLHHSITTGQAKNVVLTVKDVGAVFESATALQPKLASKIPPKLSATLGKLESLPEGERAAALLRFAGRVRTMAFVFLFLGLALCAASVWLAGEKRRAIVRLGVGLVVFAFVLGIAARFGGSLLRLWVRDESLAPVLVGVARAFLSGLMAWAAVVGLLGLVTAAGSASLLERVPLKATFERARQWLFGPQPSMRLRFARGTLGILFGCAMVFRPQAALLIAAVVLGCLAVFGGLREVFVAALHLLPETAPRVRAQEKARPRFHPAAVALIGFAGLVLVAATAWAVLLRPDVPEAVEPVTAYNGLPQLGDRTLDQVVFPTTHNSMGGAGVTNWMFPNQSASIEDQLEDGVRGFLIDITYGIPAGENVKTVLDSTGTGMAKYEKAVGAEGMDAALRIRNRLTGAESGPRDVYMCHGFCELGALKFVSVLSDMHEFLVENPGEVLVVVIQDESVDAADIVRCFEQSGLIDFVYKGPPGPWPTLREMVDSDQRVVVMTENLRSGIPWCHNAFDIVQETPYTFHDPSQFSNKPNRGGPGGTLFLMNHWIETTPSPKPTNARIVNAHDFLLKRIRAFRKERGHLPNLVAVDFYREGDLVAVARELNAEPLAPVKKAKKGGKA
jgi:hypothetical protein